MFRSIDKWLRYSGIWVTLVLNPFHWQLRAETFNKDELNPKMLGLVINTGPVVARIIIDDGSY